MMNFKKYLTVIALFSVLFSLAQVETTYSTVDTYVSGANPNDIYSTETELKLKYTFAESNNRMIFLKFPKLVETTSKLYEQVLLKLVKTGGDDGNVSIVGTDSNFDDSLTLNSSPSDQYTFAYGGVKIGDSYYLDVTEYIFSEENISKTDYAFKLFTNSFIVSPLSFASNENSEEINRPQLQFYTTKEYDIPLYDMHDTTVIDMETRDDFVGDVLKDHNQEDLVNNYGGWENGSFDATGYFRIEKDCEGTWHIIDPSGNIFYSAGLNSVDTGGGLSQPSVLKDLGINTNGSWSDETIQNIAYTPRFNVIVNFKNSSTDIKETYALEVLPVFESSFKSYCNQLAQDELQPYLNDPWVLGYFLDNELLFHRDQLSLSLALDTSNAQYQAANDWMVDKYGVSYSIGDITDNDVEEYQGYVAETYFKTISEAFKAVDPNHMLLGTRFHGSTKYLPKMFEVSGKYMDIISINYYSRDEPEEEFMDMWLENANKPFIITEFYVKGNDSGLLNKSGAGWEVATQTDRANWFENWMLKLLRNKGNVGYHWFRFIDKDGDDSNKGLFDEDYNLYEELGASISKISKSIYTLRSQILYGNYNYNDCNSDVSILSNDIISTDNNDVLLYPNPVNRGELIYIEYDNIIRKKGIEVKLLNTSGQTVRLVNGETDNDGMITLETENLSSGIYFLQILNSDEIFPVQKVIIN